MTTIKALFGVLFLGVAVWMLSRVLPGSLTLALWALLVIVGGYYFGGFGRMGPGGDAGRLVARGFGLAAIVWGVLMLVGAAAGGQDPFQPLRGATLPGLAGAKPAAGSESLPFRKIASVDDLDRELEAAQAAGKPAMLDFYADWCVSCKEMEEVHILPARGSEGSLRLRAAQGGRDGEQRGRPGAVRVASASTDRPPPHSSARTAASAARSVSSAS